MPGYRYRGTGRDELTPDPGVKPKPKPKRSKNRVAPCGTTSGYNRHLRLKEPMDDACRKANADYCLAYRTRLKADA